MRAVSEPLDCRTCGICCRGTAGTVLVAEEDLVLWRRAGRDDLEAGLVPGHFSLPGLDTAHGTCVLQGTATSATDCSIYELRPQVCRDVPMGGPECLSARRRGGRD